MPRYIDLDKQLVRLYRLNITCKDVIKEFLLSADAVKVVRCRDCKYSKEYDDGGIWCERLTGVFKVDRGGFCKWGYKNDET